jgi:hypothetical protein
LDKKKALMFVPWFIILVFCIVIGLGLAESRIKIFGSQITYYDSFPVAVAGIYFFTIISIVSAFAIAEAKRRNIIDAIWMTICGLAFYEAVFAFIYAVYSGDIHLLVPEYGFPSSGWPGYATWFLEEILIFLLSYPLWWQMRFGKFQLVLIVMFSCSFLAWLYAFDFLYPPISYSPWVLLVNTTTELTGTVLLSVLLRQKLIMKQKEQPLKNAY